MALANFPDGVQTSLLQGGSSVTAFPLRGSLSTGAFAPFQLQSHVTFFDGVQDMISSTPALTFGGIGTSLTVLEVGSQVFGTRVPWTVPNDLLASAGAGARVFVFRSLIQNSGASRTMGTWQPFFSGLSIRADGTGGGSIASGTFRHLTNNLLFRTTAGATGNAWTELTDVYSAPDIAANWTIANRYGMQYVAAIGAGAITTETAINITGMTAATRLTLVNPDATAQIRHAGPAVFGANAGPSATSIGLELQSTTKGFRLPRMSTAQRNTAFGAPPTGYDGTMIYNNDAAIQAPQVVQAGAWVTLP